MKRGAVRVALVGALMSVAVALLAVPRLLQRPAIAPPHETAVTAKRAPPIPTLYCEFYNFMHNATVVSFLFAVRQVPGSDPQFDEMAVVESDGTRTEYEPDQRLRWVRATEDGAASIASPDGATRIVLFGLKPRQGGVFWTEAGVRSDTYKNLEGKCRQANFGTSQG